MTKQYATATAFRTALEARLNNFAKKHDIDLQRLRRQVAFDRLLCRLFKARPKDLFLKGGYAMELRIQKARATKDIDLVLESKKLDRLKAQGQEIFDMLQAAAGFQLDDFFVFLVGEPTLDLEAIPYGGSRFPVEAHLDGRLFERFPMDVVVSSMVLDPVEKIAGQDLLKFAGIQPATFPTISKEQQFAEKLHAYTLPRDEDENSRVKDMVDLLLLIQAGTLKTDFLVLAIEKIFTYRDTHPLPASLEAPPTNWESKFDKLSKECAIEISLDDAFEKLSSFFSKMRD